MRLILYLPKFLFFSNINVIPFKIIPLGSYTLMETLFLLLVAALEVVNRYGLQHVRYTSQERVSKTLVDSLSWRNKFCVDDSPSAKKTSQH